MVRKARREQGRERTLFLSIRISVLGSCLESLLLRLLLISLTDLAQPQPILPVILQPISLLLLILLIAPTLISTLIIVLRSIPKVDLLILVVSLHASTKGLHHLILQLVLVNVLDFLGGESAAENTSGRFGRTFGGATGDDLVHCDAGLVRERGQLRAEIG